MIVKKDYLGFELERNKANAALYTEIMQLAFGTDNAVLIGHHICFEHNQDITTENEIPSADTLIFDHDVMKRVFGSNALNVMYRCALVPSDRRDAILKEALEAERRMGNLQR